jgi:hypothetical protein
MTCFRVARLAFVVTALSLYFGCGGGSSSTPNRPYKGACLVTLSGAATGTMPCTVAAGYDSSKNQSGLGLVVTPQSVTAQFGIQVQGMLRSGSYSLASVNGGATVTTGTMTWAFSSNPVMGSLSMTVSDVSNELSANGQTLYKVHGSADAQLTAIPPTGATGTVTMHVKF